MVCDALATIQACASEFRIATLRLIWAKPVFVTYRITHVCENAIYVKHAGNGEKGTRERGHPRKLNPEECGSLAFVNEERSSLSETGATVTMKKRGQLHSKVRSQEFHVY